LKNMIIIPIVLLSLVILLIMCLTAFGQGTPGASEQKPRKDRFQEMDVNQDGIVTLDEFLSHEKKKFQRIDKDGNGKISQAEMQAHESQRPNGGKGGDRFTKLDTNHDSSVSLEEYLAGEKRKFTAIDKNGDGRLSQDEMQSERTSAGEKNNKASAGDKKNKAPAEGKRQDGGGNNPVPSKNE
jgi:hypothetical protein